MRKTLVAQQLLVIAYSLRPFAACFKVLYVLGVEPVVYLGRRSLPSAREADSKPVRPDPATSCMMHDAATSCMMLRHHTACLTRRRVK